MPIHSLAEWLEATSLAGLVRDTMYGFPIVVTIHLMGLAFSVGTVLWFDLRLLGVSMRSLPVAVLYRRLVPWMAFGFTLMFVTGAMLFTAYAVAAVENPFFRIKAAALVAAGLNALVYHVVTERGVAAWNVDTPPPLAARIAGLTSIVVWTIVVLAGRMMSYTMF